ncbi:MAG TPA: hypothetical protein VIW29_14740 [Polyangiaceae bacterium]
MKVRACALLLLASHASAQTPLPAPPSPSQGRLPESLVLPSTRAREPEPEPSTLKLRIDGEYELRQSLLTRYPVAPIAGGPAELEQSFRLFHWLRLRPLLLAGTHWEVRAEVDVPRGMIYGQDVSNVPDSGTDFEEPQPLGVQLRKLRIKARSELGELSLGHAPAQLGMGILDNDGDQPRWFGTPDRVATFERVELMSGQPSSMLRVGAAAELLFQDERLALFDGDRLWRFGLSARFAPAEGAWLRLLTRYETLAARETRGGAQAFVFDASGGFRARLAGHSGELFGEYEGVYRIGSVDEPTAWAGVGAESAVLALAGAARVGYALERAEANRRFAQLVVSLEWGMASGDADPTDHDVNRFVMDSNHGVGLLLFGELMRFKTSRAQALLAEQNAEAGSARVFGLATTGGIAGASYLNPILLVRPVAQLALQLGLVVASATTHVVDPSRVATDGERRNFDGGSALGRSLGSELDLGAELRLPLDPPMEARLSLQGGVAFPGSAFDDEQGERLGTQAMATTGLGLTF